MDRSRFCLHQICQMTTILWLLVSGCGIVAKPTAKISSTQMPTSTYIIPNTTELMAPSAIYTAVAKNVPTTTITLTPTQTSEPITPTPGPTLSENETEVLVLDLLRNNAGCDLPCWWGFTPGKTYWTSARDFFLSKGLDFSDPTFLPFQKRGIFSAGFQVEKYGFGAGADFFVENGIIRFIKSGSETYWPPDLIKFGDPFYIKAMEKYLISKILISQGEPERVYMNVLPNKALDLPDYYILLFYPEKGMLVEYDGQSEQIGNDLRLCPQKTFVYLKLWSPEAGLSLKEAFTFEAYYPEENRLRFFEDFRPWEEISGISIDDFVKTFQMQNTCFNTPATLWGRK